MNIVINQDSSFKWRIRLVVKGEPLDLSNYSAFMQVRDQRTNALIADFSEWTIISADEEGVIDINAPAAASQNIADDRYSYDIALVSSDNDVYRPIRGIAVGRKKVTDYDV